MDGIHQWKSSHWNNLDPNGRTTIKTKGTGVQYIKVVIKSLYWNKTRGSSVGIFNPLLAGKLRNLGSIPGTDKIFLSWLKVQTVFGTPKQPHIHWAPVPLFRGKKPGSEDHYLPPSSTEVKNEWSYTYIYIYSFIHSFIHSFSSLPYDRSKASSKASSPHSAIQSFLFQMRVSSPFLKVIQ